MLVSSINQLYFNPQTASIGRVALSTVDGIQRLPQGADKDVDVAKVVGDTNDRSLDSSTTNIVQTLTENERKIVEQLKARDREVRSHEQAHLNAAGSVALGGPSFSFQTGPDGHRYAVGGEVAIDVSSVQGDPRATIEKANRIQRAALAPAEPSTADRQVAAQAASMKQEAQLELLEQRVEEAENGPSPGQNASFEKDGEGVATIVDKPEIHCEICGASHSASSHSESMRHKIEEVFAIDGFSRIGGQGLANSVDVSV